MQNLDVVLEDMRWEPVALETLAEQASSATLAHLGLNPETAEITILACDDARIMVLNGDFRAKPQPTNVLSWPTEERSASTPGARPDAALSGPDGLIELGDIAISYDTCAAEAQAAQKPLADHATHLIVHGVLHLLGYDHVVEVDATLMESTEIEILAKLGLNDPYKVN